MSVRVHHPTGASATKGGAGTGAEVKAAACDGKAALTPALAKRRAAAIRARGEKVQAYRCLHCGKWHVGGVLP
jgi:hypothetical protein